MKIGRPAFVCSLLLAVALATAIAGCGGSSSRTAGEYCRSFYIHIGPLRSGKPVFVNRDADTLRLIISRKRSSRDLASVFRSMQAKAPAAIYPATKKAALSFEKQNWRLNELVGLLERDPSHSGEERRLVGSLQQVETYLSRNCPLNSPLAMEASILGASLRTSS